MSRARRLGAELLRRWRTLPAVDAAKLREDLDRLLDASL